jgi:hypothetical protein
VQRIQDTIHAQLTTLPGLTYTPTNATPPITFSQFPTVTVDEVKSLIGTLPAKSSPLDYIPTKLLKQQSDILAPLIAHLANLSLSKGTFPSSLKTGRIKPLLKKPNLDPSDPASYRPITNLSTLSKILEKLALTRLRTHILSSDNYCKFQSAYRAAHSTETALLRVVNDLVIAACNHRPSVLIALDISAAFDTLQHDILCQRAETEFGIQATALSWLRSFITGRSNYVCIGDDQSPTISCSNGVPQGSVLGPILFALYTAPVAKIIEHHGMQYHMYADDTQLYTALQLPNIDLTNIQQCTDDIRRWYAENGLLLNPTKSEAMAVGTHAQVNATSASGPVVIAGTQVPFSNTVKLLGVTIDSTLSFDKHVSNVVRSCNYHLHALRHIRPLITEDTAKTIGFSLVSSRLDYCNSLLCDTTEKNLKRLQIVQNDLARTILRKPRWTSATPLLKTLHMLPVKQRITFKIATTVFKVKHSGTPEYLSELLVDYQPLRTLRSSDKRLLREHGGPASKLTFSAKAFAVSAPKIWNSLKFECRSCDTLANFRRELKTDLCRTAYKDS